MSSVPIVASIADIPTAVRYAERNHGSRQYVATRMTELGHADAIPRSWGILAAGPSTEARDKAADSGEALPDGSYPIRNRAELKKAVQAFGRAKDKAATRRHIIKRARALGAYKDLPDGWDKTTTASGAKAMTPALTAALEPLRSAGAGELGEELLAEALRTGIAVEVGLRDDGAILFDLAPGSLTAAGWDPGVHPRGRDGKYIEKFGIIHIFEGKGFSKPSFAGEAVGAKHRDSGDYITVKATSPGKGPDGKDVKVGDEIEVRSSDIASAPPVKTKLDVGREKVVVGDTVRIKDTNEEAKVTQVSPDGAIMTGTGPDAKSHEPGSFEMARRQAREGENEVGVPAGETPEHPSQKEGADALSTGAAKYAPGDIIKPKSGNESWEVEGYDAETGVISAHRVSDSKSVAEFDDGTVDMQRRVKRDGEKTEGPSKMPTQSAEERTITSPKTNMPGKDQPKLDEASSVQLDKELRDSLDALGINPDAPKADAPAVHVEEGEDGEFLYNGTPYVRVGEGEWEDYEGFSATMDKAESLEAAYMASPNHPDASAEDFAPDGDIPDDEFDKTSFAVENLLFEKYGVDTSTNPQMLEDLIGEELSAGNKDPESIAAKANEQIGFPAIGQDDNAPVDETTSLEPGDMVDDLSGLSDDELKSQLMDAAVAGDTERLTTIAAEISARKQAPAPEAAPAVDAADAAQALDAMPTADAPELQSDWNIGDPDPESPRDFAKAVHAEAASYQEMNADPDDPAPDPELDAHVAAVRDALQSADPDSAEGPALELRAYLVEEGYSEDNELPNPPEGAPAVDTSDNLDVPAPLTPEEQAFEAPVPDDIKALDDAENGNPVDDVEQMVEMFSEGSDDPADYSAEEFASMVKIAEDAGRHDLVEALDGYATEAGVYDSGYDEAPDLKGEAIPLGEATGPTQDEFETEFPTMESLQAELQSALDEGDTEYAQAIQGEIDRRNDDANADAPVSDDEKYAAYENQAVAAMKEAGMTDEQIDSALGADSSPMFADDMDQGFDPTEAGKAAAAELLGQNPDGNDTTLSEDLPAATSKAESAHAKAIRLSLSNSAANKGLDIDVDARLDEAFAKDPSEAHKDIAKLMTELKLGGKQRKRMRELTDMHFGGDSSGSLAKATADNLSDDNPLKEALAAKAAKAAPAVVDGMDAAVAQLPATGQVFSSPSFGNEELYLYPNGMVKRNAGGGVFKNLSKADADKVKSEWYAASQAPQADAPGGKPSVLKTYAEVKTGDQIRLGSNWVDVKSVQTDPESERLIFTLVDSDGDEFTRDVGGITSVNVREGAADAPSAPDVPAGDKFTTEPVERTDGGYQIAGVGFRRTPEGEWVDEDGNPGVRADIAARLSDAYAEDAVNAKVAEVDATVPTPDAPATTPSAADFPEPQTGATVYTHPMGAKIYVNPDGSMEAYGKDGKKKKTSATPEKLAAGHGQWVKDGGDSSATGVELPSTKPVDTKPSAPAFTPDDKAANAAAQRFASDLVEMSFEDPSGPWKSYSSASGVFELVAARRASIEDDLDTNSKYVTIKVPGGSEMSITPEDARQLLAALDKYGEPQLAASSVGKA